MTNTDLIAKLKDPKQAQPFWIRTPEEQDILRAASTDGLLWTNRSCFPNWKKTSFHPESLSVDVYILKPDYQPEPGYEDKDIRRCTDGHLRYYANPGDTNFGCEIDLAVRMSRFAGFFIDNLQISLDDVATKIHESHKVVARFRKE